MNLTQSINELVIQAEAMKKAVGVNKKYLNKTIDRLTDAWLYSQHIVLPGSLGDRPEAQAPTQQRPGCICPAGAIDSDCPVHGSNKHGGN
jgi:hypothetical protein